MFDSKGLNNKVKRIHKKTLRITYNDKSLENYSLKIALYSARKTIFSFYKYSEKMVFPKKIALEYDLFPIIRKDNISFSRKEKKR